MKNAYSTAELHTTNAQRTFSAQDSECKFLLGGIGTGNVSVGSRGQFCDWELFNGPGKGISLQYSFFALRAQAEGRSPVGRILESAIPPPHSKSHGYTSGELAGLPRFSRSAMRGEYPFVWVELIDDELGLDVQLEAFTPFIPLNADDSGIPAALIRYQVTNTAAVPTAVSVAASLANAVGFTGYDLFGNMEFASETRTTRRSDGGLNGLHFDAPQLEHDHVRSGSLSLAATNPNISIREEWLRGRWWDGMHDFWDDFMDDGRLEKEATYCAPTEGKLGTRSKLKIGSIAIAETLAPGERKTFEFVLSWHFPNRKKTWGGHICPPKRDCSEVVRNYYARQFSDSWDAGRYLLQELDRLEQLSRAFSHALFSSTLPGYVLEAVANNITVIRSPTCFRIEDGTFLSWEGCFDSRGCCEGNCTHVWNYAQTLAFLFPELERSMRRTEFLLETDSDGAMSFRATHPLDDPPWDMDPAADGQLGAVVRLYRDWKFSGDEEFLRDLWPAARRALEFAFKRWDSDGDMVLDTDQHNTYDIEFHGPNSLVNSIFYTALKAGAEIARHLGDARTADEYEDALATGSRRMDEILWNGEYYEQVVGDVNQHPYQYGSGCLSDQVFGQLLAHIAGLGYVLPEDHVRLAVSSVFKNNFRTEFRSHHNVQRTYALDDEAGLLVCSWPKGGRPDLPFVYADEVWTGIEYQVAAHLIYEGFTSEGLQLVHAVRDRHDGKKRNPWNEVECGNHYVRSLASWAVLLALTGYRCDLAAGEISFDPVINHDNFSTFFSTGCAWGIYTQRQDEKTGQEHKEIEILYGTLDGVRLG